jgi:hypothetical protein
MSKKLNVKMENGPLKGLLCSLESSLGTQEIMVMSDITNECWNNLPFPI